MERMKINFIDLWEYSRTDTKISWVLMPIGFITFFLGLGFNFFIGIVLGLLMVGVSVLHNLNTLDRKERPIDWSPKVKI